MTWTAYRVVFELRSPMHIGCGKVGNVQRTRPYVTGRVFWGALTMRLTRDKCEQDNTPATDSRKYQEIGKKVHKELAYTYFYPTTNEDYSIDWSWENTSQFRRRFLSSYASTALVYPQQAADEGLLHEVEFISPRTIDEGKQVYLVGYVFEKEGCQLHWKQACKRLQFGGERGYGWGDVKCIERDAKNVHTDLFNGEAILICDQDRLIIETERLLAHTTSTNVSAQGEIEPLVGREWNSNHPINRYAGAGQYVNQFCADLCWIPGSMVARSRFAIQNFGIWHSYTSS